MNYLPRLTSGERATRRPRPPAAVLLTHTFECVSRFADGAPKTSTPAITLRKLQRDPFGSGKEHQLAIVKLHDLVAQLDATRTQPANLGLNVFDLEADMVEAELVEPGEITVHNRLRVTIPQELNLNARCGVSKRQGDVLGFDVGDTHVAGELPAGNHH